MSIKVSIAFLTYNHADFVRETLDSVMAQQINCEYEVVIGDDCSTDGTQEILLEYSKKFDKISLILHETNVGVHQNETDIINKCSGKYVAFIEGDDYWSDPLKIQKQIDVMEKDENFYMSFTNFIFINEKGEKIGEYNESPDRVNYLDVLAGFCPKAATVLYRRSALKLPLPAEYYQVSYTDHFLFAAILKGGYGVGMPDQTACHRLHSKGVFGRINPVKKYENMLFNFKVFKKYFTEDVEIANINKGISRLYLIYLQQLLLDKKPAAFVKLLREVMQFDLQSHTYTAMKLFYIAPGTITKRIFKKLRKRMMHG